MDQNRQRDELERLIGEVQEADRAGVFARTPVDLSPTVMVKTVGPGYGYRVRNRLFIGLQVAACIALVAGLATLWQPWSPSPAVDGVRTTSGSDVASVVAPTHCGRPETLIHCFSGPGQVAAGSECSCVDLDADGDVDLADYGRFQVAYANATR